MRRQKLTITIIMSSKRRITRLRASNIDKTSEKTPETSLSLPLNGVDTHFQVLLQSCHLLSFLTFLHHWTNACLACVRSNLWWSQARAQNGCRPAAALWTQISVCQIMLTVTEGTIKRWIWCMQTLRMHTGCIQFNPPPPPLDTPITTSSICLQTASIIPVPK